MHALILEFVKNANFVYECVYISRCINWFRDYRSLRFYASASVGAFFISKAISEIWGAVYHCFIKNARIKNGGF